jgi:hypothetical protein
MNQIIENTAGILEKLKVDNIISYLSSPDLISLATNPYVVAPVILVLGILFFFKFIKTLAVLTGSIIIFLALHHTLPQKNQEIIVMDIVLLGAACFLVAAFWIYLFFIRSD